MGWEATLTGRLSKFAGRRSLEQTDGPAIHRVVIRSFRQPFDPSFSISAPIMSTGNGNTMVEFFSPAMSIKV